MRPEQVTMFGLLDEYETPQLAVKLPRGGNLRRETWRRITESGWKRWTARRR